MGVLENLIETIVLGGLIETIFHILAVIGVWFILRDCFRLIFANRTKRQEMLSAHNFVEALAFIIALAFWYGIISIAFEFTPEWYFRVGIIMLLLLPIRINFYFQMMIGCKGLNFALMNINRPFKIVIIQAKRGIFSRTPILIEFEEYGKFDFNLDDDWALRFLLFDEEDHKNELQTGLH